MKRLNKKWQAIAGVLLSCILLVESGFAVIASDAEPEAAQETRHFTYEEYYTGSQVETSAEIDLSEYEIIEISTEQELRELAKNCQLDSWSVNKYVKLTRDIALTDGSLMIPTFGGVFDGNGYEITNLQLEMEGSGIGLFRVLRMGGTVQNLTVAGHVKPTGSRSQVGGIVGENYGTIQDCTFRGKVEGDSEVGGIVGHNGESGEIRGATSYANVSGAHSTGGVAGYNGGVMKNCRNMSGVNTYSTEVSYDLEDFTREALEDWNSVENVAVHTDTGGIAGLSEGKIYFCINNGTIGYQHVGYNVGGIVGRLSQGYLQNCTNKGRVLGRKDVGGVVGQLEPFLEAEYVATKFGQLDEEMNYMLVLLEQLYTDAGEGAEEMTGQAKVLSEHLQQVSGALRNVSNISRSMWYLYQQELTGATSDYERLNKELTELPAVSGGETEWQPTVSGNDVGTGLNSSWETEIEIPTVSGGDAMLPDIELPDTELPENQPDVEPPDIEIPEEQPGWNTDLTDNLLAIQATLSKFGNSTADRLERVNQSSKQSMDSIATNLDTLDKELVAAEAQLQALLDTADSTGTQMDANMEAVIAQAHVLQELVQDIRDDLFAYEGSEVTDQSTDYDTSSFQKGKITLCQNQGAVEADTNVGGIVGQIATEYDIDPEEDITLTGEESFRIEQSIKAVVRECTNRGEVTAKKDYAGGVAGKADFGVLIACEAYSTVSSSSGSFVGGIVGSSGYAVRDCAFQGKVSGKNYVSGIAGYGCDLFGCYVMADVSATGEYAGNIAGDVQKEGILSGNFYVANSVGGVDGRGYEGGAQPLSYEEFSALQNLPKEFAQLTVTFVADGQELASVTCLYGADLTAEQLPEIPEKDGYYAYWNVEDLQEITSNRRIEAVYERWVTALASEEMSADGKAILLVEGHFLPETVLTVQTAEEGISFTIETEGVAYTEAVDVRYLCEEGYLVEVLTEAGWQQAEVKRVGSYLCFDMERPGSFRLKEVPQPEYGRWIALGAAILAGILFVIILISFLKKAAKRKSKKAGRKQ